MDDEERNLYLHMHDQEEYLSSGYSTISSGSDQDLLIEYQKDQYQQIEEQQEQIRQKQIEK